MIPTERALADMAAVECEQDDGDPFGWWDGGELTPKGARRGAETALSAPESVTGGIPAAGNSSASEGRTRASGQNGATS